MADRHRLLPGVLAGLLLFGGVACEDNATDDEEDVTPELDGGEGEEGVEGTD